MQLCTSCLETKNLENCLQQPVMKTWPMMLLLTSMEKSEPQRRNNFETTKRRSWSGGLRASEYKGKLPSFNHIPANELTKLLKSTNMKIKFIDVIPIQGSKEVLGDLLPYVFEIVNFSFFQDVFRADMKYSSLNPIIKVTGSDSESW